MKPTQDFLHSIRMRLRITKEMASDPGIKDLIEDMIYKGYRTLVDTSAKDYNPEDIVLIVYISEAEKKLFTTEEPFYVQRKISIPPKKDLPSIPETAPESDGSDVV